MAQDSPPSTAAESAERFTLDLPPDDVVTAPSEPAKAPYTIDTPIAALVENWRSKAVLDRNLPGLTVDRNFAKFRALSLRALQPVSGGRLTDALLEKTAKDLAEIPSPTP